MQTADAIRRTNLAILVQRFGSQRALADAIDKAPAQISQWINSAPESRTGKARNLHGDTAREIERRLGLAVGWMDHSHDPDTATSTAAETSGVPLWLTHSPQHAQLAHSIDRATRAGTLSPATAKHLAALIEALAPPPGKPPATSAATGFARKAKK